MAREKTEEGLTLLGQQRTDYGYDYAPEALETFQNKHMDHDYWVRFNCPEFTTLCPITGQPDYGTIYNHGDFHEDVVNVILRDLIRLMEPKYIEVQGKFLPRGGISIDPYANYGMPGTKYESLAWERLAMHDRVPERVDNR